ncbi:hypothetical protein BDD12DRAFT_881642 [Trichophaea hybrida]|nr:hypothetical protein BDD12DRAFT_881642 [Trichophaea hybrida]
MSNDHGVENLSQQYRVNGDTWTHGESSSPNQICQRNPQLDFPDIRPEENDESDLTELDIEEGEGLEEYKDVDEEEEEEDDVEQEGNENEKEELVLSQDMEHSVIVVAPRR